MKHLVFTKGKSYLPILPKQTLKKWNQPELTSNTSYGIISSDCYAGENAYLAFNGEELTEVIVNPLNDKGVLDWQLPEQICITKLSILGKNLKTIKIFKDDNTDSNNLIEITAESINQGYVESAFPRNYFTSRLYIVFESSTTKGVVNNILIEGYTLEDYALSDYDTKIDGYVFAPYKTI